MFLIVYLSHFFLKNKIYFTLIMCIKDVYVCLCMHIWPMEARRR